MEFVYYIFLPALAGGIIQGVTGFGAGVVMMMFLPLQYSVVQSAGISSAICMILCAAMVYRYRKTINFKKIIAPAVLYLAISSISILFAKMINQEVMKIILGIFLIILSLYFLFFNKKDIEPKGIVSLLCIVISGICDGLFVAIGHEANTDYLTEDIPRDNMGRLIPSELPTGMFVAGDVQSELKMQIATAVGTGCSAAMDAIAYLNQL